MLKRRGLRPTTTGILEFRIDGEGMHIGQPFRHLAGILSGSPTLLSAADLAQVTTTLVLDDKEEVR